MTEAALVISLVSLFVLAIFHIIMWEKIGRLHAKCEWLEKENTSMWLAIANARRDIRDTGVGNVPFAEVMARRMEELEKKLENLKSTLNNTHKERNK